MINEAKSEKLFKLYQSASAWKIIYKFIIPSILVAFPVGIFAFVDQIFVVNFIPKNPFFTQNELFGEHDWEKIKQAGLPVYNVADLIKSAVALALPITLLFDILPSSIAVGAMAVYARKLGLKKFYELKKVFNSSCFFSLGFGLFFFILIFSLSGVLISSFATPSKVSASELAVSGYSDYLKKFDELSVRYATSYVQILSVKLTFEMTKLTLSLLLRVESKTLFPVIASLFSNVLNILLDYVFLTFTNLGMLSAALATVIGCLSGFAIIVGYLFYASRKNLINFHVRDLKTIRLFDWKLFFPIIRISTPAFLSYLLYSVSIAFFIPIFGDTLNIISNNLSSPRGHLYYQSLFGGAQAVTFLTFAGISGIFDGMRGISNFAFENLKNGTKRLQKLFNLTTISSIGYAAVMFLTVYLCGYPLYLILGGSSDWTDFQTWLLIIVLELPTYALSISSAVYFQSSNRNLYSCIFAFVQAIVFVVVLFVLREIIILESKGMPKSDKSMNLLSIVMAMTLSISSFISSSIICLIGSLHVNIFDKKRWLKQQKIVCPQNI